MIEQSNRIPSLDGIRAISIALVLFSHISHNFGLQADMFGNLGVRIFFVISGFLITSILLDEIKKTNGINLKRFYFRRTFRIFPAYYFYILFIFILTLGNIIYVPFDNFLIAVTYTTNYFSPISWELGHSWSLAVEEQFYLLLPGILFIFSLKNVKRILIGVIIIVPYIRLINLIVIHFNGQYGVPFWFTFPFHNNADVLATGCILAIYKDFFHNSRIYRDFLKSTMAFLILPILIFTFTIYIPTFEILYYFAGITIINISIALGIDWLIFNHKSFCGKVLNTKPFIYIGMMSYSVYLWQQPFTSYSDYKFWTHFPINILFLIVLSVFSYTVIEKRFLNLRKKLEKIYFSRESKEQIQIRLQQKPL